jgi:hypothetical protein
MLFKGMFCKFIYNFKLMYMYFTQNDTRKTSISTCFIPNAALYPI